MICFKVLLCFVWEISMDVCGQRCQCRTRGPSNILPTSVAASESTPSAWPGKPLFLVGGKSWTRPSPGAAEQTGQNAVKDIVTYMTIGVHTQSWSFSDTHTHMFNVLNKSYTNPFTLFASKELPGWLRNDKSRWTCSKTQAYRRIPLTLKVEQFPETT